MKIEIEKIKSFQCLNNCCNNLSIFIIIEFIKIVIDRTIISSVAINNEFNIIGVNRKDINIEDTHINEIEEDK